MGGNHSYQQQQEPWRTTQRRWLKSCHLAPLCCSSCSQEELISPSTFFCPCSRSCITESTTFLLTCYFFPCSLLILAKIPPTYFAPTSTSSAHSECDLRTHLWLCKLVLNELNVFTSWIKCQISYRKECEATTEWVLNKLRALVWVWT